MLGNRSQRPSEAVADYNRLRALPNQRQVRAGPGLVKVGTSFPDEQTA